MALMSRTHAIKAAFVAGFLLIFLNLIGLRLDVRFDRSPLNLSHMSSSLQWPKRTRTSNEINSQINNNYTTINYHNDSSHKSNNYNYKNNSETFLTTYNNNNDNESLNSNNRTVEKSSNRNNNESGDIKIYSNNSANEIKDNVVDPIIKSTNNSSNETQIKIVDRNKLIQNVTKKPTKHQQNLDVVTNENSSNLLTSIMKVFGLNPCPPIPPNLEGPIQVDNNTEPVENVEKRLSVKVSQGGRYKPQECKARYRVAIIVPFRDRAKHLPILLKNLHPLLIKQQIDYGIFIVEQSGTGSFNRAKLMNVGYVEALKLYEWDCFIFHDVDLLPMDDRNLYNCPDQPRHMSVAIDIFGFKLPYSSIFGGVSAMTTKQFQTVNGFSNSFWGWGGEDDDMSNRLKHAGFHIARYPVNIARYIMLNHKKEKANPKRYQTLVSGANRYNSDGLNSLKYKVIQVTLKPLYTWILVDIYGENTS